MASPLPHLRSVASHDGAVILDVLHDAMITLNPTGAYIWQRLEKGMTFDRIVAELASETNTDSSAIAADVARFIDQLHSKSLLSLS